MSSFCSACSVRMDFRSIVFAGVEAAEVEANAKRMASMANTTVITSAIAFDTESCIRHFLSHIPGANALSQAGCIFPPAFL
jgi:hypothetical protein